MSVDGEKKFVMKHIFTDVKNLETHRYHFGPEDHHFGVPWRITFYRNQTFFDIDFECLERQEGMTWSIDTTINTKILKGDTEENHINKRLFAQEKNSEEIIKSGGLLEEYLMDGNLNILECHVTIHKMTGIEFPMEKRIFRSFDDESAKKYSDIVLKVKDKKYHASKVYLASQSSYFESLFYGNFDEAKQSEVELKDIEPENFQTFLEVLYGEPVICEDNIEKILQLADMYDAKTVIRQCEFFYLRLSQQDLKSKFNAAVKYNMKELQQKCISEIKTVEELEKMFPDDRTYLSKETCIQLFELAVALHKKK